MEQLADNATFESLLVELGYITEPELRTMLYVIHDDLSKATTQSIRDELVSSYLIKRGVITKEDAKLIDLTILQLKSNNPLLQVKAQVRMAKSFMEHQVRKRIRQNSDLSDTILHTGDSIKHKSHSSEYAALKYLTGLYKPVKVED